MRIDYEEKMNRTKWEVGLLLWLFIIHFVTNEITLFVLNISHFPRLSTHSFITTLLLPVQHLLVYTAARYVSTDCIAYLLENKRKKMVRYTRRLLPLY
jgi:hypothetical protein